MSHRITHKTEITDMTIAKKALESMKWSYDTSNKTISVRSGPMRGARIDLKTGVVTGDTDYHKGNDLESLNQSYAEYKLRDEIQKNGGSVESRQVLRNGDIEIISVRSFG